MTATRTALAIFALTVAFAAGMVFTSTVGAAPSSPKRNRAKKPDTKALYDKGMQLVKSGEYEAALVEFRKVEKKEPKNADALNMIAYSSRKLGRLDTAFKYYDRALKYREQFPQAREYLAEAHIQAALEQAQILESYGDAGKQELAQLIHAFQTAADSLTSDEEISEIDLHRW